MAYISLMHVQSEYVLEIKTAGTLSDATGPESGARSVGSASIKWGACRW